MIPRDPEDRPSENHDDRERGGAEKGAYDRDEESEREIYI